MNKLYVTLASTLVLGASAFAIGSDAWDDSRQEMPRAERPAREARSQRQRTSAPKPESPSPARVKGGINGDKQLYGIVWDYAYSYTIGKQCPAEIHADGNHVDIAGDSEADFNLISGCYFDGKFLGIGYDDRNSLVTYYVYDAETWNVESYISYTFPATNMVASDLAYDPETRRIYGSFSEDAASYNTTDRSLCWIDLNNGFDPIVKVGGLPTGMRGMSFDKDGRLFGIGFDGVLYQINKNTAELTKIGDVKLTSNYDDDDMYTPFYSCYESADIEWETGDMYFSAVSLESDTFIFKIDTSDASTEMVADFGYWSGGTEGCEVFSSIFFRQNTASAAGTPKAPVNVKVEPQSVELKAKVEFDMPALDIENNPLSGQLEWAVKSGENTLATGKAQAGEHVTATVDIPSAGMQTIAVTASAGQLNSVPASVNAFIGCDTPALMSLPGAFADGCEVSVTWRPAYAVNGGNLAPLTYKVVRQPDNVVVTESTSATFVTDNIENTTKQCYTYEVTPIAGTVEGEKSVSRPVYAGLYFGIPHVDSFDDETLFNQYPAIDNNKDGNTWWIDTKRGTAVYSSNESEADDYLLIGPFSLVAGSLYTIDFTAGGHNVAETFAAYVGTDPADVRTFSTEIIPPTMANPRIGDVNAKGTFTPVESGSYYFAIKACSDAYTKNLYIYDVKVSGVASTMPAAPAVEFVPVASGASFNITIPTTDIEGNGKANATALNVYRDKNLIATITDGISDGAKVTYTDNSAVTDGFHVYDFGAVCADGEGRLASVSAYVGIDQPASPRGMRAWEDIDKPGLLHVTWEAPKVGVNGGYVDPDNVGYSIDWLNYGVVGTGEENVGTNRSFELQIPEAGLTEQDIIAFTVKAYNTAGSAGSASSETRSCYYGAAKQLPLQESWTDGKHLSGIWSGESVLEDEELFESWWDYGQGPSDVRSQDGDGYYMWLSTSKLGGGYRMRSPRVEISTAEHPVLVFHLYSGSALKEFNLEAAIDDKPMTVIRTFDPAESKGKWVRYEIDLTPYKSCKYLQFGFTGYSNAVADAFVALDNVTIFDYVEYDLGVSDLTGPAKAEAGKDMTLYATVRNSGSKDIAGGDYSLNLYRNDKLVSTFRGRNIPAFQSMQFALADTPLPTDPEFNVYRVEIAYDNDRNQSNDRSNDLTVRVLVSEYPAVTDLSGKPENGVTLTWSEPDLAGRPNQPVTDDFESYESFEISGFGDWKTYDGDGRPTVILATFFGPVQYNHVGEPMAWQVMHPGDAMLFSWYAHSGDKMLVSFQACFDGQRDVFSDDWLISPELDGSAQRISFFASAGSSSYTPELMEIYYSTTGTDIEDFQLLSGGIEVPYDSKWIEYFFNLPEGTRHFAIVHKSFDRMALMIDDVTYIPAGSAPEELNLQGYNVYRDGELLTDKPVTTTTYNDTDVEKDRQYSYHVTAVWDKGESAVSNRVDVTASTSALESVEASRMTVTVDGRTIRVAGVEGQPVSVYTVSGQLVATVTAAPDAEIEVAAAGIYIVRAAGQSAKVAVR